MSAVALVLVVLGTYVLLFSSISLLYKVVVVVYIFVLLFLFSLALLSLDTIGESRAEGRTRSRRVRDEVVGVARLEVMVIVMVCGNSWFMPCSPEL